MDWRISIRIKRDLHSNWNFYPRRRKGKVSIRIKRDLFHKHEAFLKYQEKFQFVLSAKYLSTLERNGKRQSLQVSIRIKRKIPAKKCWLWLKWKTQFSIRIKRDRYSNFEYAGPSIMGAGFQFASSAKFSPTAGIWLSSLTNPNFNSRQARSPLSLDFKVNFNYKTYEFQFALSAIFSPIQYGILWQAYETVSIRIKRELPDKGLLINPLGV